MEDWEELELSQEDEDFDPDDYDWEELDDDMVEDEDFDLEDSEWEENQAQFFTAVARVITAFQKGQRYPPPPTQTFLHQARDQRVTF